MANNHKGEPPCDYDDRRAFGKLIKRWREAAELRQQDIADALGCSFTHISAIELGRTWLPAHQTLKMAELLGVPKKEFARLALMHREPVLFGMMMGES